MESLLFLFLFFLSAVASDQDFTALVPTKLSNWPKYPEYICVLVRSERFGCYAFHRTYPVQNKEILNISLQLKCHGDYTYTIMSPESLKCGRHGRDLCHTEVKVFRGGPSPVCSNYNREDICVDLGEDPCSPPSRPPTFTLPPPTTVPAPVIGGVVAAQPDNQFVVISTVSVVGVIVVAAAVLYLLRKCANNKNPPAWMNPNDDDLRQLQRVPGTEDVWLEDPFHAEQDVEVESRHSGGKLEASLLDEGDNYAAPYVGVSANIVESATLSSESTCASSCVDDADSRHSCGAWTPRRIGESEVRLLDARGSTAVLCAGVSANIVGGVERGYS